ncbi:MAG TPA: hypothetical protein VJ578_04590 [Dehalococcoidia bacterium]|nr:hypothetical protein [Dehalococcoidia bacterium]
MSVSKAGRLIGLGVVGVVAFGMALWLALGQPGIGEGHGIGSAYRDSDLDSNLPPIMGDYTECQGSCPGGYFDDNKELWVRTNPLDPCANTTTANDEEDDKWPPDFNDNRYVNSFDILAGFYNKLGYCEGQQGYYQRSDLNADTCVTVDDQNITAAFIGSTCQELFADSDNDGFPNIHETEMGTDPDDDCGTDAWPPDINNDNVVDNMDYWWPYYGGIINNCWPSAVYMDNIRLDMNADRCLDDTDVGIVAKYISQQCTP